MHETNTKKIWDGEESITLSNDLIRGLAGGKKEELGDHPVFSFLGQ